MSSPTPTAPSRNPSRRTYATGDVLLGKYELQKQAGAGAMGEVWFGMHRALQLPVAVKLLRGASAIAEGLPTLGLLGEQQLLSEAQATARLSHSAIVRVFDFGVSEAGDPFLVMERLEGENLRERLEREERIEPVEAVALLLPVIHAMTVAHAAGIVHRDLKPENIFLARNFAGKSTPKVLDFGIADLPWVAADQKWNAGTPEYMAPEHAAFDGTADHRSDIWAVGVILYELLSGITPITAMLGAAARPRGLGDLPPSKSPPPLDLACGVDPALWSIIAKAMRPLDERWGSMQAFGDSLASWLLARGVEEDAEGVSLRTRWLDLTGPRRPLESAASSRESLSDRGRESAPKATRRSAEPAQAASSPKPERVEVSSPEPSVPRRSLKRDVFVAGITLAVALVGLLVFLHRQRSAGGDPASSATPGVIAEPELSPIQGPGNGLTSSAGSSSTAVTRQTAVSSDLVRPAIVTRRVIRPTAVPSAPPSAAPTAPPPADLPPPPPPVPKPIPVNPSEMF